MSSNFSKSVTLPTSQKSGMFCDERRRRTTVTEFSPTHSSAWLSQPSPEIETRVSPDRKELNGPWRTSYDFSGLSSDFCHLQPLPFIRNVQSETSMASVLLGSKSCSIVAWKVSENPPNIDVAHMRNVRSLKSVQASRFSMDSALAAEFKETDAAK